MIGPLFFNKKIYECPDFSGFLCERSHFSDILVYAHIFRSEIFRGCLSSWYYMNWLWYLCNNHQKMDTKKSKGSIWIGQQFGWSSIRVRFLEGQVYEWGRFWNTGSHTRTKIAPKLSPPPSPTRSICIVKDYSFSEDCLHAVKKGHKNGASIPVTETRGVNKYILMPNLLNVDLFIFVLLVCTLDIDLTVLT